MLFPDSWPRSTAPRPPQIRTPLAAFSLDLVVNGESFIANRTGAISTELGTDWSLVDDQLEAEVLVSTVTSRLPPGMFVDNCVVALIRLRANRTLSGYSFECTHDSEAIIGPSGPCSGQYLEAQEWNHSGITLTLGTQDLEAIVAHRRNGGLFPIRLARSAAVQALTVLYKPNGFAVQPPPLESNEAIQVQFVAAWAPESAPEFAPWFAVDFAPGNLLVGPPGFEPGTDGL